MVAGTDIPPREEDVSKMLKCNTHLGTKNCDVLMEPYVFKRRFDGTFPFAFLTACGKLSCDGAAVRMRAQFYMAEWACLLSAPV